MSSHSITHDDLCVNPTEILEIIEGTGEILEDKSGTGRIRPWSKHKMNNIKLVELFEKALEIDSTILSDSRLESLRHCSDFITFLQDASGNRKLKSANFCRVRVCPMCNWRRSLKLFSQVSAITDAILADKKARFIFVTLTVKNCTGNELTDTINATNKGFKYITNTGLTFALAKQLKSNLMGYMKAMEITYNSKDNTYHPHIHCIFEVKPEYFAGRNYMNKQSWIELWQKAMKLDYAPSVDVRNIKNGTPKAVAEIAKYPVKMSSILNAESNAVEALIYLYRAIFGRRLVTFGGDFRDYKQKLDLDDVENGDLVHVESEEKTFNAVAQVLFKYRADCGAYIC